MHRRHDRRHTSPRAPRPRPISFLTAQNLTRRPAWADERGKTTRFHRGAVGERPWRGGYNNPTACFCVDPPARLAAHLLPPPTSDTCARHMRTHCHHLARARLAAALLYSIKSRVAERNVSAWAAPRDGERSLKSARRREWRRRKWGGSSKSRGGRGGAPIGATGVGGRKMSAPRRRPLPHSAHCASRGAPHRVSEYECVCESVSRCARGGSAQKAKFHIPQTRSPSTPLTADIDHCPSKGRGHRVPKAARAPSPQLPRPKVPFSL
jgi:hypothetical protein